MKKMSQMARSEQAAHKGATRERSPKPRCPQCSGIYHGTACERPRCVEASVRPEAAEYLKPRLASYREKPETSPTCVDCGFVVSQGSTRCQGCAARERVARERAE